MMVYLRDIKQEDGVKPHYNVGIYGGKFMPMHKGHLHCLDEAAKLCGKMYLIMFTGGFGERFVRKTDDRQILSEGFRWEQVMRAADMYDNVTPLWIDVSECVTDDGKEDWDAETPLVLSACERFDAVFGSEPTAYVPYFERAFPWADYVVVDADRKVAPISATKVRAMKESEARTWMV